MQGPDWVLVYQPDGSARSIYERFSNGYAALQRVDQLSQQDRSAGVETDYSVWRDGTITFYGSRLPPHSNRSIGGRNHAHRT